MNPYIHPNPPTRNLPINRPQLTANVNDRARYWREPNRLLGLSINKPNLPPTLEGAQVYSFNCSFEEYYFQTPHVIKSLLMKVFGDTECLLTECLWIVLGTLAEHTLNNFRYYCTSVDEYLHGFIESMNQADEDAEEHEIVVDWYGDEGTAIGQAMYYICVDLYHAAARTLYNDAVDNAQYQIQCFKVTSLDPQGDKTLLGNHTRFFVAFEDFDNANYGASHEH